MPQWRGGRTFQRYVAGVGSMFPAASIALTFSVCRPGRTVNVAGEPQRLKTLRSSLQLKVDPGSVEANLNFATRLVPTFGGFFKSDVPGATVSGGRHVTVTATVALEPPLSV